MSRPVGIAAMKQRGYKIILVRDGTIAFETPETLSGEWFNKVAITTVEWQYRESTTLADLV